MTYASLRKTLIKISLQDKRGRDATLWNFISDTLVTKCVEVIPRHQATFCDTDWLQLITI